jgi:hypothetical protein
MGLARHLAQHPDDPGAGEFRERSARWYDSYLRWGRDTKGFRALSFGTTHRLADGYFLDDFVKTRHCV